MLTIGHSFSSRLNSLNSIRLLLATLVIISHSYDISGLQGKPLLGDLDPGSFAVYGFFALSGYLITGSRERNKASRYFWARVLRIYPAFWVCLLITAFGFARVAGMAKGGWSFDSAAAYVSENFTLKIIRKTIGHTLDQQLIQDWNGSLWTLLPEFLCYVGIGILFTIRRFRAGIWMEVFLIASLIIAAVFHYGLVDARGIGLGSLRLTAPLFPFFLAGGVVYKYRFRLLASSWYFIWGSTTILVSAVFNCAFLVGPLPLAYCCVWLGVTIPPLVERLGDGSIDLSYGLYIYAFPVQQLLVIAGVHRFGILAMISTSIFFTTLLASLSWFMVEKRALRLKAISWSQVSSRCKAISIMRKGQSKRAGKIHKPEARD